MVQNVGVEPLLLLPKQACSRYTTFCVGVGLFPTVTRIAVLRYSYRCRFATALRIMALVAGGRSRTAITSYQPLASIQYAALPSRASSSCYRCTTPPYKCLRRSATP